MTHRDPEGLSKPIKAEGNWLEDILKISAMPDGKAQGKLLAVGSVTLEKACQRRLDIFMGPQRHATKRKPS